MGKQENCVVATRASKKRAYDATATPNETLQELPVKNKRVVLGELTNSPNLGGLTQEIKAQKPKPKSKPEPKNTAKKKVVVEETEKAEIDVNCSPNDSQKCGYAPLIYQHLHALEVCHYLIPPFDVNCSPNDSQKCGYAPLIYQHLHALEVEARRRPLPNYMQKVQKDVTPTMREILVDWLVEVAEEYKLVSDTLYLTVSYIDRFLSSHALNRNKLQLLGVASMLVASKYEEISPPHVEDFCYITDNTYTREEVVNMEKDVLKFLHFEMGSPTPKTFLRIFNRAAQDNTIFSNLQFEFLGSYLAELSLLDYACVRFLPSIVAASAIFLSRFTIQPEVHPWSLALQQYTGYKPGELKECVLTIHDLQLSRKGKSVRAVREKYTEHKFKSVAALCPPSEIPVQYFNAVNEKH